MSTIDQNVADSARAAMARLAAAIRGTAAVVAVLVAAIGLAAPMSLVWWVPGLLALVVWTGVYVWITWRRGVFVWLVIGDGAMSSMLCLAIGKLVPLQALSGGTNWVAVMARTDDYCE